MVQIIPESEDDVPPPSTEIKSAILEVSMQNEQEESLEDVVEQEEDHQLLTEEPTSFIENVHIYTATREQEQAILREQKGPEEYTLKQKEDVTEYQSAMTLPTQIQAVPKYIKESLRTSFRTIDPMRFVSEGGDSSYTKVRDFFYDLNEKALKSAQQTWHKLHGTYKAS